jgi:flagellar biogenesis protein FliO
VVDVGRIVFSLLAVVAGCLGTAWLARRSRGIVRGGLRVVSRVQVSKGSSLLVVSVGPRMLLVGAGEGGLRLICELDPADLQPPAAEEASSSSPASEPVSSRTPGDPSLVAPGPNAPAPNPNPPGSNNSHASNGGPWTGLVRHLQRMTLRTTPVGPSHVRKR